MVSYACAFSQSEMEKYFEWIISQINCLVTQRPKQFQLQTSILFVFIWDSLFLDWDSIFFIRWVSGLTITICNQNHWIYSWVHASNFSIEKQCHQSIIVFHSCTKRFENIQVMSFSDNPKLHRYPCQFVCIACYTVSSINFFQSTDSD